VYNLDNILLAALPSNLGALFFLRTLQAVGSPAVVSMGAGTVADVGYQYTYFDVNTNLSIKSLDYRAKASRQSHVVHSAWSSMWPNSSPDYWRHTGWRHVLEITLATNAFLQQAVGALALGNKLRSPAAAVAAVIVSPLAKHMGWGG
jgi:hypothetical protein